MADRISITLCDMVGVPESESPANVRETDFLKWVARSLKQTDDTAIVTANGVVTGLPYTISLEGDSAKVEQGLRTLFSQACNDEGDPLIGVARTLSGTGSKTRPCPETGQMRHEFLLVVQGQSLYGFVKAGSLPVNRFERDGTFVPGR